MIKYTRKQQENTSLYIQIEISKESVDEIYFIFESHKSMRTKEKESVN